MELERLTEIGESFFFRFALAGDIDFKALGNVPVSFAPNGCSKRSSHKFSLTNLAHNHFRKPSVAGGIVDADHDDVLTRRKVVDVDQEMLAR